LSLSGIPKVSVCIPTFNGASYVGATIDSVLKQKFQDFEIVIVDNCSTDHTEAIVKEHMLLSEKIIFYKNEQNIGMAENFNKCLEYARGEYIKYLCADDLLLPDCLEQMVAGLDAHQDVSLVSGGRLSINENGKSFGLQHYSSETQIVQGHEAITRCLFGGNFIGEPSAVMFRKSELLNHFRAELPQLMDMDVWFRLLENGHLLSIEMPLCSIRFHKTQMTRENIKSGKLIEDNILIFNEFAHKPYVRFTVSMVLWYKFLMTYRVWLSRKFISPEVRIETLTNYGMLIAYPFMPIIFSALDLSRRFVYRLKSFHQAWFKAKDVY
jgi:glycosyltransferase involved in cell wall biosynthesis